MDAEGRGGGVLKIKEQSWSMSSSTSRTKEWGEKKNILCAREIDCWVGERGEGASHDNGSWQQQQLQQHKQARTTTETAQSSWLPWQAQSATQKQVSKA